MGARTAARNASHALPPGSRHNRATDLTERITDALGAGECLRAEVDEDCHPPNEMVTAMISLFDAFSKADEGCVDLDLESDGSFPPMSGRLSVAGETVQP
ncbi:hypothetical protein [Mycobacterium spongiae]|uniref:Uncharacterized protein n=1 Tax=Mycobacterium spongiae TaxID=886343 RepID=A0A975JWP4_9MYCO|nr:hypothetical protein [Mycobacterium spongiae]QUR67074.1 hypothetical protein F6B93_08155 [Mycobacterium spongiae]